MFDVYGECDNLKGKLVLQEGTTLVYENTHFACADQGAANTIPAGQSYTLIMVDGDVLHLDFEETQGSGEGLSDELLIGVLIARTHALLEKNHSEELSLAARSLQMALDSFAGLKKSA